MSVQYGLQAAEIEFLPRGGDMDAAVYRVKAKNGVPYFVKLTKGSLAESAYWVPRYLSDRGIKEINAPLVTQSGQLWTRLSSFQMVVSPFVEGRNAFETALSEHQWVDFGAALRAIHSLARPPALEERLRREDYTPRWRERVRLLLARVRVDAYQEPVAAQYARMMRARAGEILSIVQMAEQLGSLLKAQAPRFVLCHSDLHAGNLLVSANGRLTIVDWDFPVLALKERDLMFIGGGVGSAWYAPQEEAWFYRGYGPLEMNPAALAYYRLERIVQDIAEWGERVLLADEGGQDRERWLQGFQRWFQPHDVVEMAYKALKDLPPELRFLHASRHSAESD